MSEIPGRTCPISYRYGASALAGAPTRETEVLYVIGGLYGNVQALESVMRMIAGEAATGRKVKACFNGDFNWFNVSDSDFQNINASVFEHDAIRGNVETELTAEDLSAGCGCAYPAEVSDEVVERSNRIFERLHGTAARHLSIRTALAALPMYARYQIGEHHVGVVHGDYENLAGWKFDVGNLQSPLARASIDEAFGLARVDVFASSHTCLPALQTFESRSHPRGKLAVINNGAAGMPNFKNTSFGILTRIGLTPAKQGSLYGTNIGPLWIEALAIDFDAAAWRKHFLQSWPQGSDAYESYYERILNGPDFEMKQAA
jgi:hypothetical protein